VRYYVLNTPEGDEVARLSRRGSASYFESTSQRWIPDPLLAVEVKSGGEWRHVEAHELPPSIADVTVDEPRPRRFRLIRRGRHSRP
jgi:hypothetical protein